MQREAETAAAIGEALRAANAIATHLSVAWCLVGAEDRPRRTEREKALSDAYRVSLWLRFFADELPKLENAIAIPDGDIAAVDRFVVESKVWADDPLRFKPSLSATSAAVPTIMAASVCGGQLLRAIERITGQRMRDIWCPEAMRRQASALDESPAEVYLARDDLRFAIELHQQETGPLSAEANRLFPPMEVERLLIEAERERPPGFPTKRKRRSDAPCDELIATMKDLHRKLRTWPKVRQSLRSEQYIHLLPESKRDDPDYPTAQTMRGWIKK